MKIAGNTAKRIRTVSPPPPFRSSPLPIQERIGRLHRHPTGPTLVIPLRAESKEKYGAWNTQSTYFTVKYVLCDGTQCRSLLYRTLCPLQSRLLHIYHGQPYARVDLYPLPASTLTLCQSRLYAPVEDFRFDLLPCLKVGSRVHTAHSAQLVFAAGVFLTPVVNLMSSCQ